MTKATDPNGDVQHHVNPVLGWIRMALHEATGEDGLGTEPGALRGQVVEMDAETLAAMARHLKAALDAIDR